MAAPVAVRIGRLLARGGAAGALAWLAGFAWFVADTARAPPPPPRADGIVALTGGPGRIEAAFRLLQDGSAASLLISGAGGGAGLEAIARLAGVDVKPFAERITLGRDAQSTQGNADEAAIWAARLGAKRLIVVTADYHMRRALLEFGRAMPDVALSPWKVRGTGSARVLAGEYTKWLLARLGAEWDDVVENSVGQTGRGFEQSRSPLGQVFDNSYLISVRHSLTAGSATMGMNAASPLV